MVSRDHVRRCTTDEALQISARGQGATQIVAAVGAVDVATTAALSTAIRGAIVCIPQVVVVDLSEVGLFAAAGLSTLLESDEAAGAAGCELLVMAGDGAAQRFFELTDARRRLTIAP